MKKSYLTICLMLLLAISTATAQHQIYGWGANEHSQLGFSDRSSPYQYENTKNWDALAIGDDFTLLLRQDGSIWLTNISNTYKNQQPFTFQIGSDNDWTAIASGSDSWYAIKQDGSLWAWGNNQYGQLGDGSNAAKNIPTQIGTDNDWASIAIGATHCLAIKQDGSLLAWGRNNVGQVGDGTLINRPAPIQIGGAQNWKLIVAGDSHTLSFKALEFAIPERISPKNQTDNWSIKVKCLWNKVQAAAQYELQIGLSPTFQTGLVFNGFVSDTSLNLNNLSLSSRYYWRIRAINGTDKTDWSSVWYFDTRSPKLFVPKIVMDYYYLYDVDLKIFWTYDEYASLFELQVAQDSAFSIGLKRYTTSDSSQLTNLNYSTVYYARVKAMSALDTSSWSEIWKFRTKSMFSNMFLIAPANNSVSQPVKTLFKWASQKLATNYTIEISKDNQFSSVDFKLTSMDTTIAQTLEYNKTYFWRVRANSATDTSGWSAVWTFTTRRILVGPLVIISPVDLSINNPIPVLFKWYAMENAESYLVKISRNQNFATIDTTISTTDTSFALSNLKYGTKYYWSIKPINANDDFPELILSFTTEAAFSPVELVYPLDMSINVPTTTDLRWRRQALATNYVLEYSTDSLMMNNVVIINWTDTTYLPTLSLATKYYWRVRAANQDYDGDWSDIWEFTTKINTGISDVEQAKLLIYPQPANDELNIQLEETFYGEIEVIIYSQSGEIALATKSNASNGVLKLNIDSLPNAMYILKIGNQTLKFIKI